MNCLHHLQHTQESNSSENQPTQHRIIKKGYFIRLHDKALIQRYRCLACKTNFSEVTHHPCKYQKKPFLNQLIFEQLVSGLSQRRLAKILCVNKKTVVRKFIFLGKHANQALQSSRHIQTQNKKFNHIQFDDMESFEHSKCKPISITLVVEEKTRFILGFRTASMPAKGLLVNKALKKYGKRKDERAQKRDELFKELKPYISKDAVIKSDENPHYPKDVKTFFPSSQHLVYKGRRGCVVGQGELKAGGFDPLFSFNHTAAMLRANINRLYRRTWNTTKKQIALEWHIALYCWYHNCFLIDH